MAHEPSSIRRRGGIAAIAAFIVVIIALGLATSGGFNEQDVERGAVELILSNMAANPTMLVASMWGFVILNILIPVFGIELYRSLTNERSGLLFAPLALVAGSGLFVVESLLTIGIIQGIAPAYGSATGAGQTTLRATSATLFAFRNQAALLAGVLIAVAAALYGRALLRSEPFPRWVGYGGILIGAVGFVGGLYPLFHPLSFLRLLEQLFFMLWMLAIGILLLR